MTPFPQPGPQKVAGATATPTLGVWLKHHPLHYFGLATNVTHLVPEDHSGFLRGNRSVGEQAFARMYRHVVYTNLGRTLSAAVRQSLTGEIADEPGEPPRPFRSRSYGRDYYAEHRDAGLDYLGFGEWQRAYGRWWVQSLNLQRLRVLDVGCACGSIARGLGEAGAVVEGVDVNEHMIQLGRQTWPDLGQLKRRAKVRCSTA